MVTVFLEPAFGDRRAVRHIAAGQTHRTHVCPQPYYHSCEFICICSTSVYIQVYFNTQRYFNEFEQFSTL